MVKIVPIQSFRRKIKLVAPPTADDPKRILAKDFEKKINESRDYKARMAANEALFLELQKRDFMSLGDSDLHPSIGKLIGKKYRGKMLFIFGAAHSEILYFSSFTKEVYFVSLPPINQKLPTNVHQLKYDHACDVANPTHIQFDHIFSNHVIEHIHRDDLVKHLSNAYRLLKPGGEYFLICPSMENISRSPVEFQSFHIGRYTYHDVAKLALRLGYQPYRPIINPYLLGVFLPYRHYRLEHLFTRLPTWMLSILGLNSLYIRLKKA